MSEIFTGRFSQIKLNSAKQKRKKISKKTKFSNSYELTFNKMTYTFQLSVVETSLIFLRNKKSLCCALAFSTQNNNKLLKRLCSIQKQSSNGQNDAQCKYDFSIE